MDFYGKVYGFPEVAGVIRDSFRCVRSLCKQLPSFVMEIRNNNCKV